MNQIPEQKTKIEWVQWNWSKTRAHTPNAQPHWAKNHEFLWKMEFRSLAGRMIFDFGFPLPICRWKMELRHLLLMPMCCQYWADEKVFSPLFQHIALRIPCTKTDSIYLVRLSFIYHTNAKQWGTTRNGTSHHHESKRNVLIELLKPYIISVIDGIRMYVIVAIIVVIVYCVCVVYRCPIGYHSIDRH